jgi:1-deoxy-D-xylulose-5-phosphate synthase
VGQDGATHQGAFDVSFLRAVPGLQLAAAHDSQNLHRLLHQSPAAQPLAIRYAKTYTAPLNLENVSPVQPAEWLFSEGEALLIAHGQATQESLKARALLQDKIKLAVLDLVFLKPMPEKELNEAFAKFNTLFIAEEVAEIGGMGEAIRVFAQKQGYKGQIFTRALPDAFVPHGSPEEQRHHLGLDAQGLAGWIKNGVNA